MPLPSPNVASSGPAVNTMENGPFVHTPRLFRYSAGWIWSSAQKCQLNTRPAFAFGRADSDGNFSRFVPK
ncbi:Uncharacterised protein [Burkholderia pseudomallei]|nr:Uncharacterised protein [Burkholderia pseudomallei]